MYVVFEQSTMNKHVSTLVWWLRLCFGAMVLSLLFEKFVSSCGKDLCEREITFQKCRGSTGSSVCCATDAPSLIRSNLRSKMECLLWCEQTTECSGANWKAPHSCELFSIIPKSASQLSGCSFFEKGETFGVHSSKICARCSVIIILSL